MESRFGRVGVRRPRVAKTQQAVADFECVFRSRCLTPFCNGTLAKRCFTHLSNVRDNIYVRRCGTPARTVLALCNIQSRRSAISLFRRSFLCAWRILHTQTFVSEEKRRLLVYRRMIFRTILNDIRLYLAVFRSRSSRD